MDPAVTGCVMTQQYCRRLYKYLQLQCRFNCNILTPRICCFVGNSSFKVYSNKIKQKDVANYNLRDGNSNVDDVVVNGKAGDRNTE